MRRPLTLKDHHHEQRIFSFRLLVSAILVTLLTVGLVGRMAWLQIFQHSRYTTLSDENRVQTQAVPPPRGLITDRNGEILAANRPDGMDGWYVCYSNNTVTDAQVTAKVHCIDAP